MGPMGLGPKTIKSLKSLKIMKLSCFFQHGKDARRNSAKVALNDSSRSLIWNFWGQIKFWEMYENAIFFWKYVHNIII